MIFLPSPAELNESALNQAIYQRYSCRDFLAKKLNLFQVSNLLWAGGGRSQQGRCIPSAGALYPLQLYLVVGEDGVEGLEGGLYLYDWAEHGLSQLSNSDFRAQLVVACLGQEFISQAGISIVISADYRKTSRYYGKRGIRYVHMEVGHSCQNIHLEAVALGLGTVIVGAFEDEAVKRILGIREEPVAIMPVGYPQA